MTLYQPPVLLSRNGEDDRADYDVFRFTKCPECPVHKDGLTQLL